MLNSFLCCPLTHLDHVYSKGMLIEKCKDIIEDFYVLKKQSCLIEENGHLSSKFNFLIEKVKKHMQTLASIIDINL